MDQHVKARLTGAVVVVTLGVIFIPMLLDGPEPEAAEADDGTETTIIELGAPRPPVATTSRSPASPRPAGDEPARMVAAASPPASAPPAEDPPARKPEPRPAPPAEPAAAGPAGAEPGIEAVVEPWEVQVGSFSRRDNAVRLRDNLARGGFAATVSTVVQDGRTLHRVRVGPVSGRPAAESLARRLEAAGQSGRVVPGER